MKRKDRLLSGVIRPLAKRIRSASFVTCLAGVFLVVPASEGQPAGNVSGLSQEDFSFAYWLNGYRKHAVDRSDDLLCFETGCYGLTLDLNDLGQAEWSRFDDDVGYPDALNAGVQRMSQLDPAELVVEISQGERVFRAIGCGLGKRDNPKRLEGVRLWESGRLVQHFDLRDLVFADGDGNHLDCEGTLDVVVWPESLTFTAELIPPPGSQRAWETGTVRLLLKTSEREWSAEMEVPGSGRKDEKLSLTLPCDFRDQPLGRNSISVRCSSKNGQAFPVTFVPGRDCYVATVEKIRRGWETGYTDIRNYDEFEVVVENGHAETVKAPFLLDFYEPASITGLVPMLCDTNGVPAGIPVQLSKNWHYRPTGAYLRAYALLPAVPGRTTYILRVVYGFYGSLPSASHAQLSLVGYGGHGRWDQLAIGCWGETFCLDMDMSLVDVAITDVRLLMTRNGLRGSKWNWTDAGWGGDWLCTLDAGNRKRLFRELRTAYLAHGPCLTEVRYDGTYGDDRAVDLQTTVRTLRTDDYARTFHSLRYTFDKPVRADAGWLFRMGGARNLVTPTIAYGNRAGLIRGVSVPTHLSTGEPYIDDVLLDGEGPWWVAFPDAYLVSSRRWGTGTRALIIRSYRASVGGKIHASPTISMPVNRVRSDGRLDLDLLLVPPRETTVFGPGDQVEMDLEWITLPRVAADYYGPNAPFKQHLTEHPRSWKTVHREAMGNDLKVQVTGGSLLNAYPLLIRAEASTVMITIEGGVGMVPIRFEGLSSPTGTALYQQLDARRIRLDQSVHGNDFWQTDIDTQSGTYWKTYSLPLDGLERSTWVLSGEQ